jgi:heat shock protein HtpX
MPPKRASALIIGWLAPISAVEPRSARNSRWRENHATIIAQLVFGILAMVIVMWFSRQREFRADAGGARLGGRDNMIGALERLQQRHGAPLPDKMAAFGISGPVANGLKRLFMTHPPIEERIAALRAAPI